MTIPPEVIDLLICSAGVDPEKGTKLEALVSKGVDWNLVIEHGHRHDIFPLLYWSFKTHCPDKVPDPVMKELGDFFKQTPERTSLPSANCSVSSPFCERRVSRPSHLGARC